MFQTTNQNMDKWDMLICSSHAESSQPILVTDAGMTPTSSAQNPWSLMLGLKCWGSIQAPQEIKTPRTSCGMHLYNHFETKVLTHLRLVLGYINTINHFGKKIYNSIMLLNPKLLRLKSYVLSFFCQKFHLQNLTRKLCLKKSTRKLQFLGFHMVP